jgi:hypothetical protein
MAHFVVVEAGTDHVSVVVNKVLPRRQFGIVGAKKLFPDISDAGPKYFAIFGATGNQ